MPQATEEVPAAETKLLGIRIDRDLHRRARVRAAEEERSLAELVRDAVERYLAEVAA